jgi:hypothetical protein
MHTNFSRKPERKHLGDLGIDGRIILKLILEKYDVMMSTGLIWLRIGTSGGTPEKTIKNLRAL